MYRRIDARTREMLERIELLPVNRVHRAAAREAFAQGEASAERVVRWSERFGEMLAVLRGSQARERHG